MTPTNSLLDALRDIGPMSAAELSQHLGLARLCTNSQIRKLRSDKAIRITRFDRQPDGVNGRLIPVYALGNQADAVTPKRRTRRDTNQRYHKRHAATISARRYSKQRQELGPWGPGRQGINT